MKSKTSEAAAAMGRKTSRKLGLVDCDGLIYSHADLAHYRDDALALGCVRDAERLARKVLAGRGDGDYRDAGYRTPLDAARAMVGDGNATEEWAARIVAETLKEGKA